MANSIDCDQMLHSAAFDLGVHCLLKPVCQNSKGKYGRPSLRYYKQIFAWMPCPLLTVSQSDSLIQIVDINSHTEWQTVQIQISWLPQKPSDLNLQFAKAGYIRVQQNKGSWRVHIQNFIKNCLHPIIISHIRSACLM